MKQFRLLTLLALLMTAATGAWAQEEITTIPNGDFETWTYDGEDMPNYWNSNATGDGSFNGIMGGKQLKRSTDVRPGSSGQYSCSIWTKSVMGAINIGILTSGRIHFGSMSSTNKENYIYSDRDGSNTKNNFTNPCAMPFTGKPTAVKVWVKYVQGGTGYGEYATAKFSATIHGDADYVAYNLAEHDNDDNKALVVASAEQEIAYNNGEWEQLTIPFNYTDNNVDPAYILINAYTNAYPGKGKANDYLYIDDIELEYAPAPATYSVTMKNGVKDADKWTVKVGEGQAQALPIGGLKGDGSETVTLQYNGRLKVKSVKAVKKAPANPYANAKLGDLFYSDGTFSTELEAGKTPIGVIAYLGTDAFSENGTTVGGSAFVGHGLVLSLKNAASDVEWGTEKVSKFSGQEVTSVDGLKRTTNVSGYTNTATLTVDAATAEKYPAAYEALNYNGLTAPTGTTGWFLPSAQQWLKMIEGLGGLTDGAPNFDNKFFDNAHTAADKWEAALSKAGSGNYDSMTNDYFWFWSSSECTENEAVSLGVDATYTGYGCGFFWDNEDKGGAHINSRVRPVLAF